MSFPPPSEGPLIWGSGGGTLIQRTYAAQANGGGSAVVLRTGGSGGRVVNVIGWQEWWAGRSLSSPVYW